MREKRKIRIVTDAMGFAHVYVVGTDIELSHVLGCRIELKSDSFPVAALEILEPEVEVKPMVAGAEVRKQHSQQPPAPEGPAKREIRFRAWDGTRMHLFVNHAETLSYNDISGWNVAPNQPDYHGEWICGESQSKTPHFTLMQYTGLQDKNGREIYEGDILGEPGEPRACFQIVWDERGLAWAGQSPWAGRFLLVENRPGRDDIVIGNIYEHPQLLEPKP